MVHLNLRKLQIEPHVIYTTLLLCIKIRLIVTIIKLVSAAARSLGLLYFQ